MAINLFHQCGHNAVWNRESLTKDGCGSGLIVSPVHQNRASVEKLSDNVRSHSFFDPQFYLPNSQKPKLASYDFFPEVISNGFATADFALRALDAANRCVAFQVDNGFLRVVIPARHFGEMYPDYTDRQDAYAVHPFLQAISEQRVTLPIYLTVPVTKAMLLHAGYRAMLLNWITSYPELAGVYLLVEDERPTKQIQELEFLKAYLTTVTELVQAGLIVTLGHANTEGLLFTLVEGCELTFGAYENTRMFSIDKFVVTDEERRGPKARLYVAGLVNWIQYSQAKQLRDEMPDLWRSVYDPTTYGNRALAAAAEPHFGYPGLYKHFFLNYDRQVATLGGMSVADRYTALRQLLLSARDRYEEIQDFPIDLERHGAGNHIQPWLDLANWYHRTYLA